MAEMAAGHNILQPLGVTGIPIINVENACASSGSSLRLACESIAHGIHDIVLVLGVEKAPRGFVANSGYDRWQMWTGLGVNPLYFATQAQEHMIQWGTTVEQLAKVSVKNHRNAVHNPYAMYRKEVSLEEVLHSKRVCDPLTLLMLCAPNEGAAAAVLCAEDVVEKYTHRYVEVAAAALCTRLAGDMFVPAVSVPVGLQQASLTERAAKQAYEIAGIGPEDLDLVELQDTDVGSEIVYMEGLGLCPKGDAGKLIDDGTTEPGGRIPVNVSGGLLSKGEPLGASSLGQVVEVTWQLRGDAGLRQLEQPQVGLCHSEGAGGNCSVIILKNRGG